MYATFYQTVTTTIMWMILLHCSISHSCNVYRFFILFCD